MDTRTKEAVRYLGYGKYAADDKTLALISDSFLELDATADKRIIYRIFELERESEECIKIGTVKIKSRQLGINLKGCDKMVMLGATLGISVDMLMKRYALTDMARTVVLQACGAAMLEEYLDGEQERIKREAGLMNYFIRPRFSPGYGDFPIEHQSDILRMLDAAKKIGLSLTAGSMLTPTKSVTAVIGMSREQTPCHRQGCEVCPKTDCIYRRGKDEKQ